MPFLVMPPHGVRPHVMTNSNQDDGNAGFDGARGERENEAERRAADLQSLNLKALNSHYMVLNSRCWISGPT